MTRMIRRQKNTVFGVGEGETEKIFLRHLSSLYAGGKTSITIYSAGGKDASHIVAKAVRVRGDISYRHSFIFLDTDVEWTAFVRETAITKGMELIGNTPCVEGLFLGILEPSINHSNWSSNRCKKTFKDKYLHTERSISSDDCKRLFSREVLQDTRTGCATLSRVINIFEGNFN